MEIQRYARWRGGKGKEGWEENILTNSNSILSRPSWRAHQTVFPSNLILHRLLYHPRFSSISAVHGDLAFHLLAHEIFKTLKYLLKLPKKDRILLSLVQYDYLYFALYLLHGNAKVLSGELSKHTQSYLMDQDTLFPLCLKLNLCKITGASNSIFQLKGKHHIGNQEFLLHKQVV